MAVTNTPGKSDMRAVTIPGELYAFLMGEGEIDGTSFGDLNANLPGRFWWRALLRTAASSRPPADQVPDMVERVARAIAENHAYRWESISEAERNAWRADAIAALQAVPADLIQQQQATIERLSAALELAHGMLASFAGQPNHYGDVFKILDAALGKDASDDRSPGSSEGE